MLKRPTWRRVLGHCRPHAKIQRGCTGCQSRTFRSIQLRSRAQRCNQACMSQSLAPSRSPDRTKQTLLSSLVAISGGGFARERVRVDDSLSCSLSRSLTHTSDAGTRIRAQRGSLVTLTLGSRMTGPVGLLPGTSACSPRRGSIISSDCASSEAFVREWLQNVHSQPQACFSPPTGAVRIRSKAWSQAQTQRKPLLGGATTPCRQTLPRLLSGAVQIPSVAATRSPARVLRTFAEIVERCRVLLLSVSRRNSLSPASGSNIYVTLEGTVGTELGGGHVSVSLRCESRGASSPSRVAR